MMNDENDDGVMADESGVAANGAGERAGASSVSMPFNKGVTISVTVDPSLVTSPDSHYVEMYGVNGYVALLVDTFDSHPGLSEVEDGKERYVRLVNIASQEELYHRHVESAIRGISVGDPILSWNDDQTGFTIHLTSEPEVTVVVDAGGEVHESP